MAKVNNNHDVNDTFQRIACVFSSSVVLPGWLVWYDWLMLVGGKSNNLYVELYSHFLSCLFALHYSWHLPFEYKIKMIFSAVFTMTVNILLRKIAISTYAKEKGWDVQQSPWHSMKAAAPILSEDVAPECPILFLNFRQFGALYGLWRLG